MAPSAISALIVLCESVPTTVVSLSAQYPLGHNLTGRRSAASISLSRSNPDPSIPCPFEKRDLDPRPPMVVMPLDSFILADFLVEYFVKALPNMALTRGRKVGKQAHNTPTAGSATVHSHESLTTTIRKLACVWYWLHYIPIITHWYNRLPNLRFPYRPRPLIGSS